MAMIMMRTTKILNRGSSRRPPPPPPSPSPKTHSSSSIFKGVQSPLPTIHLLWNLHSNKIPHGMSFVETIKAIRATWKLNGENDSVLIVRMFYPATYENNETNSKMHIAGDFKVPEVVKSLTLKQVSAKGSPKVVDNAVNNGMKYSLNELEKIVKNGQKMAMVFYDSEGDIILNNVI